jgi:transposase-like protein
MVTLLANVLLAKILPQDVTLSPRSEHPFRGGTLGMGVPYGQATSREFTDEFKAETVKRIRESGRTIGSVARKLDLTETAVFSRSEDPDRNRGATGRGEHRLAVSPRGYRGEPLLPLEQRVSRSGQEAPAGRYAARSEVERGH